MIKVSGPTVDVTNLEVVSLASLKTYIDIEGTTEDALLQILLDNFHSELYELVGYRMIKKPVADPYVFIIDGSGGEYLDLPHWPIDPATVTIEEVDILDSVFTVSVIRTLTSNDWYPADTEFGTLRRINNGAGWLWPMGENLLRVTMEAGYAAADIPPRLSGAICKTIGTTFNRIKGSRWDASQMSREAESWSFRENEIPKDAMRVFSGFMPVSMGFVNGL